MKVYLLLSCSLFLIVPSQAMQAPDQSTANLTVRDRIKMLNQAAEQQSSSAGMARGRQQDQLPRPSANREQAQARIAPALPRFNQDTPQERPLPPVPPSQSPDLSASVNREQVQPRVASIVSKFNQNVQPERPLPPVPLSQGPDLSSSVNIKEAQAKIAPLWSRPNPNMPQSGLPASQNAGPTSPSFSEQASSNLTSRPQNAEKGQSATGQDSNKEGDAESKHYDFSLSIEEDRAQTQTRQRALQVFDNGAYFGVAKKFEVLRPIHQYYLMRDLEDKITQELNKLPPQVREEQTQILHQASEAYESVLKTGYGLQRMDAYVSRRQLIYYLLFDLHKFSIQQKLLRDAEKADKDHPFTMNVALDAFKRKDWSSFHSYTSKMSIVSQMSLFNDISKWAQQKIGEIRQEAILKNAFAALEAKDYDSFVHYYSKLRNKERSVTGGIIV